MPATTRHVLPDPTPSQGPMPEIFRLLVRATAAMVIIAMVAHKVIAGMARSYRRMGMQ